MQYSRMSIGSSVGRGCGVAGVVRCVFTAIFGFFLTACVSDDENTQREPDTGIATPTIKQFSVSHDQVSKGQTIQIMTEFTGTSARIEPDIGDIESSIWYSHTPDEDTEYSLTVVGESGAIVTRSLSVVVGPESKTRFSIVALGASAHSAYAHDSYHMGVKIEASEFEIDSVTASVGGVSQALNLTSCAVDGRQCTADYQAELDLSGIASGRYVLDMTVQDVKGNLSVGSQAIHLDRPPEIHVTAPISGWAANSDTVAVDAQCEDKEGSCRVRFVERIRLQNLPLIESHGRLHEVIELPFYGVGDSVRYALEAIDEQGQTTRVEGNILVKERLALQRLYDAKGDFAAFDGQQLAFWQGDALVIDEINSDQTTSISSPSGRGIDRSHPPVFSSNGIVFVDNTNAPTLFYFSDGKVIALAQNVSEFHVAGQWVLWKSDGHARIRDLETNATQLLGNDISDIQLLDDGTVFYTHISNKIVRMRYSHGITTELVSFPLGSVRAIKTSPNGTRHMYLQLQAGSDDHYALTLLEHGQAIPLQESQALTDSNALYRMRFALTDSLAAYHQRSEAGNQQVWMLDKDGNKLQRSFFQGDSLLFSLADDGTLRFTHSTSLFRASPGLDPVELIDKSSGLFEIDSELFYYWGISLFKVIEQ